MKVASPGAVTDPPGLLRECAPEAYERARRALGETTLQDLERRLTLQAIDECWAEHLATVAEIREGIHLAEVGGLSPLEEFQKGAAESFGVIFKGGRYLLGLPVNWIDNLDAVEWRNNLFERCDGRTMKPFEDAQRHSRPRGLGNA